MKEIERKILDKAVELWPDVSPSKIAKALNLKAHANVSYYFPAESLKQRAAEHAVKTKNSRVIVMLVADNHPAVAGMSKKEMLKHFKPVTV